LLAVSGSGKGARERVTHRVVTVTCSAR
jgi:hypothetical protein